MDLSTMNENLPGHDSTVYLILGDSHKLAAASAASSAVGGVAFAFLAAPGR